MLVNGELEDRGMFCLFHDHSGALSTPAYYAFTFVLLLVVHLLKGLEPPKGSMTPSNNDAPFYLRYRR